MRREGNIVYLSKRNLLALLHKVDIPGSLKTIVSRDGFAVVAEPDDTHYAGREEPPGPMHPQTETFIEEGQATATERE